MAGYREFKPWLDKYGFIHIKKGEASHNGALFTSEMLFALEKSGQLRQALKNQYIKAYEKLEIMPGLIQRHPEHFLIDIDSIDNHIGWAMASKVLNCPEMALRVVEYGKKNNWNFNNQAPKKFTFRTWLGRFPHMQACLYKAAGLKVPSFMLWYMGANLLFSSLIKKRKDWDSWVLGWMQVVIMRGHNGWLDGVCDIWSKRMEKVWGLGIGEALVEYFGDKDHPNAKNLLGEYGR